MYDSIDFHYIGILDKVSNEDIETIITVFNITKTWSGQFIESALDLREYLAPFRPLGFTTGTGRYANKWFSIGYSSVKGLKISSSSVYDDKYHQFLYDNRERILHDYETCR